MRSNQTSVFIMSLTCFTSCSLRKTDAKEMPALNLLQLSKLGSCIRFTLVNVDRPLLLGPFETLNYILPISFAARKDIANAMSMMLINIK